MSLVQGIHHVSMKCQNEEEYKKVFHFYKEVLEIPVARRWENGIMFDTGAGIIEVFVAQDAIVQKGTIRHFAFATKDVASCVKAVRDAGYEVFIEPKDIEIPSTPSMLARIAFCKGPLGEEIEFFEEK